MSDRLETTDQDDDSSQTPTEILAARIVNSLVEASLINPKRQSKLLAGLIGGTLSQDDWRILVETQIAQSGRSGEDDV